MTTAPTVVIGSDDFRTYLNEPSQAAAPVFAATQPWPVGTPKGWGQPNMVWVAHDVRMLHWAAEIPKGSKLIIVLRGTVQDVCHSINLRPFADSFERQSLVLVVGGTAQEQASCLSDLIDIDAFEGWRPVLEPELLDQDVDYFRLFYRSLAAKINVKSLYKATKIQTTYLFLRNALINAPLAYRHVPVAPFQNTQSNKPVLVVAAGPSLNKQLPLLAQYQQVFTILAVDTVWPILKKNGITPDMVFALDPRSKPSWPKDGVSDTTCFAVDIGCAPGLVWSNCRNHLFSTTSLAIMQLLGRLGVRADIIPTGGSVATTAFGFARFMGGNPIVLIGQDLALTGGKDHADGYLHAYTDDFLKARTDKGFDVEGYDGQPVKTEKQLLFYKTWYENQVKTYPETMVINATEGGAKIEGCLQIPFAQVCAELAAYQSAKQFDFPRHELVFDAVRLSELSDGLDGLIANTRAFIEQAHAGELLIGKKGPRSQTKLLAQIDKINAALMSFDEDARFVVDAFSQVKMTQISYQTVTDTQDKTLDIAIGKYLQIYRGIQESGHLALAMLEQIRQFYERLRARGAFDADLLDELVVNTPKAAV